MYMAKRKIDYRKIWEGVNGKIPKDDNGMSYEVHHLDGDRNNNDISNLICVSIKEHYDIHFNQQDYYACASIKKRMELTVEERKILSEKIAEANRSRPNPFNDPEIQKKIQEKKKLNYKKENHQFYGKKRPEHSEYMKSIGWGKIRTEEHQKNLADSIRKRTQENPPRAKMWNMKKDDEVVEIKNLKKFCRDNELSFYRIYNGGEDKGWKLA